MIATDDGTTLIVSWGSKPDDPEAYRAFRERMDRDAKRLLASLNEPPDPELLAAAREALSRMETVQ